MRLKLFLLPLLAASTAWGAPATGDDIAPEIAAKIRAALHERIPEIQVKGLHNSPQPGLYELDAGSELLYTNETGSLIFAGRIVDTKSRQDLTNERWNELNAIDFSSLPLDLAIKTVRGDGSRKLAVFADPLCPYCRQLEQELQGVTNITIYTFLFPLESIHPGASVKAVNIWCAKDRGDTWSKWMLQKTEPANNRCAAAPIDKLKALGEKLNIDSTPTMFTADGKRTRGAIKHNDLESLLASAVTHK
jgi:thiol:disulfide interchange protein DsbC